MVTATGSVPASNLISERGAGSVGWSGTPRSKRKSWVNPPEGVGLRPSSAIQTDLPVRTLARVTTAARREARETPRGATRVARSARAFASVRADAIVIL